LAYGKTITTTSDLSLTVELSYTVVLNEKKRQVNVKTINIGPCLQQNSILTNVQCQWCGHFLYSITIR